MAKKKSLDELKMLEEKTEKKISQSQHELIRMRNKRKYLEDRNRKERVHRLITKGAAFESLFKGTDCLTELESLSLIEKMTMLPQNQSLVDRAVYDHMRMEKRQGEKE